MLKPDQKTRVHRLAEEMAATMGLQQGHLEVHVHKGEVKEITTVDKSLKFGKETENG